MRELSLLLLSLLLAAASVVPAQATVTTKEFAVAINQSGRQRMLSQKMSKEFLLVLLEVDATANRTEVSKTVKLFDSTLTRLLQGDAEVGMPTPPNDQIRAQLELVKGIWTPFRTGLEQGLKDKPDSAALHTFAKESLHLVSEMDKAVGLYEQSSVAAGITGTGAVVNVAGRQRMLTQRMSKDMLLLALGVAPEDTRKDLQWARGLFEKSLHGLLDGDEGMHLPPTTTKSIRLQIA